MEDLTSGTTQGALNTLLQNMANRYSPEENQRQILQRNNLINEYEQTMRNPPKGRGVLDMSLNNWIGSGGGALNAARGLAKASQDFAAQQDAEHQAKLRGLAQMANLRSGAIKEEDAMLRMNLGTMGRATIGKQPSPEQLRTVYTSARNEAAQIAKDYQFGSAEERNAWITEQANKAVNNYLQNFATVPTGPRGTETIPTNLTQPPQQSGQDPTVTLRMPPGAGPAAEEMVARQLQQGLIKSRNPATQQQGLQQLSALQTMYPYQPESAPPAQPGIISPPLKDQRTQEQVKKYGAEEGKELFIERKALNDLYSANTKLSGQLNLLEKIYSDPNIPEGQLAEYVQNIRSGLKSLGVEVSPSTGPADLARAVGVNLALTQKNADGKNLLPGAMSNYEDQLLQKMAPTLSLTNDGRMALVQYMKQVSKSNMRLAEEASRVASGNKDMLTPSWYARKERVMLEEMARLKVLSDQLMKQYGSPR